MDRLLDRAFELLLAACAAAVVVGAAVIVGYVVGHGCRAISLPYLLREPVDSGRDGGIGPILAATACVTVLSVSLVVPIGLAAAAWLTEFVGPRSRTAAVVRHGLNVLASVPSIVFGLFGNAFFCVVLGWGYSIASGACTLACMALPTMIRAAEETLRSVPLDLRRSTAALGMNRETAILRVYLPAAWPGIVAGVLLSLGRAVSETAALLFTSGFVDRWPRSVWDPGRVLSVHIYELAMHVSGGNRAALTAASVLIVLLLAINAAARWALPRLVRISS
ncbi:MAG: phosphate ABC transporter permease PstA [Planctomycetota bacterium]|nr:MAG: phosphate ABC transporter permease PstA [Planctomycetota bacterium]